jgi:hypothetical protein
MFKELLEGVLNAIRKYGYNYAEKEMSKNREAMLEAYRGVLELAEKGEVINSRHGICNNIIVYSTKNGKPTWHHMDELCKDWHHFSGNRSFPVPGSITEYEKAQDKDELWKGEQLVYRISLLNHCIKKLEELK